MEGPAKRQEKAVNTGLGSFLVWNFFLKVLAIRKESIKRYFFKDGAAVAVALHVFGDNFKGEQHKKTKVAINGEKECSLFKFSLDLCSK